MPLLQLTAGKDTAAQTYMQMMFVQHTNVAIRSFGDAINSPQQPTDLSNHPSDFELYHFGSFDSDTGRFEIFDDPVLLIRGKDIATQPSLT